MGMNPRRSGGSPTYALTVHGLNTVGDMYGNAVASAPMDGIVRGASGAPASSYGAKFVSAVPPSLRGASSGIQQPSSGANIPFVGNFLNTLPGGTAVHWGILVVLVYFVLRFLMKESG